MFHLVCQAGKACDIICQDSFCRKRKRSKNKSREVKITNADWTEQETHSLQSKQRCSQLRRSLVQTWTSASAEEGQKLNDITFHSEYQTFFQPDPDHANNTAITLFHSQHCYRVNRALAKNPRRLPLWRCGWRNSRRHCDSGSATAGKKKWEEWTDK